MTVRTSSMRGLTPAFHALAASAVAFAVLVTAPHVWQMIKQRTLVSVEITNNLAHGMADANLAALNTAQQETDNNDVGTAANVGKPLIAGLDVLSPEVAASYRAAFSMARQDVGKNDMQTAVSSLQDSLLAGHLWAEFYKKAPSVSRADLANWLRKWGNLPEANEIYKRAKSIGGEPAIISRPRFEKIAAPPSVLRDVGVYFNNADDAALAALWRSGLTQARGKNWQQAREKFSALADMADKENLNDNIRAAVNFWLARSLQESGEKEKAVDRFRNALRARDGFYSEIAARILGIKPQNTTIFNGDNKDKAVNSARDNTNQAVTWNDALADKLRQHEAGKRSLALLQVGETEAAERQLDALGTTRRDLRSAILSLAAAVPLPDLLSGISGANQSNKSADALFPLPPWQPQGGFKVDRALVYALAHHESRLDPLAISAKGAHGLMQLMPDTVGSEEVDDLLDPESNLAMGQRYIRELAKMPVTDGNLLRVLAAYNAGPGRLERWLEDSSVSLPDDPLLLMETLPWRETRIFMARVLMHYARYQIRLGRASSVFDILARGKMPKLICENNKDCVVR